MAKTDITKLGTDVAWQDVTSDWTNVAPVIDEEKCKQCLLCVPCCPDSAIPVKDYKRCAIDYDHCKGCGICVKACPFGAIKMEVKKNA